MKRLFKRKALLIVLALVVVVAISLIGYSAEKKVTIKLASTITTSHPHMEAARKFGQIVKEKTKGRIEVQVFPDGQLGREGDIFEGVMMGSIQMYIVAPAMVARYYPPVGISDMAYIWDDSESHKKIMRGEIGNEMRDSILKRTGTRVLDFHWDYGSRQVTANKSATKPAEFKGLKIRCPGSSINVEIGKAIGYTATPMDPNEVYTAIQQGVVDGQANPIPTVYARKFYEVNKYLILTEHIHQFEVLGINEKFYQSLSKADQKIIQEAAWEAGDYASELNNKQEQQLLAELKKNGMQVITPDLNALKEATAPVAKLFEDKWGKGLFEQIRAAQK